MTDFNLYALVLAGGSGERFWPLSRRERPKQLLSLFSRKTLLEGTLSRLRGLVPPERTLVLTNCDQEAAVRDLLPWLPEENIVAEPAKRDTAAAIALGVGWVARRDPEATMVVLPADHLISDVSGFQRTLRRAALAANTTGSLVTVGITPGWPCPSFGYIEQGAPVSVESPEDDAEEAPPVYEVARFREKPSAERAAEFLEQGNFRWNAGMFLWTIPAILKELHGNVPELGAFARRLGEGADLPAIVAGEFAGLPKNSIDYAVLEKAQRVLVVEAAFDWDDVGGWPAAAKYWERDDAGNAASASLSALEASNNIVYADPRVRVALVGVKDLIVVQTPDALLVCDREQAEKIKQVVAILPPEFQ
ncbi:MAG TPA: sugar phosphate nucleotidyltransferase [Chthoniobacteraceae bacterium]|nr:sugar phosphate nucleotidyltransferase [Chthoniobacteraceae bacterium]